MFGVSTRLLLGRWALKPPRHVLSCDVHDPGYEQMPWDKHPPGTVREAAIREHLRRISARNKALASR